MLAIIIGIFYNNRRIDDLRSDMNQRFADMNQRFADINQTMTQRFADINADLREIKRFLMELLKKESV